MAAIIFITLCMLCASVYARTTVRTNQYMDTVLYTQLRNSARFSNVDPAHIANFSVQFTDKSLFTNNKVKIDYYGGQMTGLLDVQRLGNCSPVKRISRNDTLNCTISFRNIKFTYLGKITYGKLAPAIIHAQANMSQTNAFVEVTTSITRNYPVAKTVRLTHSGTIKAKLVGSGSISSKVKNLKDPAFAGRAFVEFSNVFHLNFVPSLARAALSVPMPVV